jgi:hypothetical protein
MIAEILETHLEMIADFMEQREPVPAQLIEHVRSAVDLVEESIPEEKLKRFLAFLDKLPTR